MILLKSQTLLNFLQLYGLFSIFVTIVIGIVLVKNYFSYKSLFFSIKDLKLQYLDKEMQLLQKNNEELKTNCEKLQAENDELSKIIINKIRWNEWANLWKNTM